MTNIDEAILLVSSDSKFLKQARVALMPLQTGRRKIKKIAEIGSISEFRDDFQDVALCVVDCSLQTLKKDFSFLMDHLGRPGTGLGEAIWLFVSSEAEEVAKALSGLISASRGRWLVLEEPFSDFILCSMVDFGLESGAALRRSSRLEKVTAIARGLGHSFANILFKAGGRAEIAALESDPLKVKTHLEAILGAVERGGEFVRSLHHLPKSGLHFQDIEVETLLDSVFGEVSRAFPGARYRLIRKNEFKGRLQADSQALVQALYEIIVNAVLAMPEGGEIQVHARPRGAQTETGVEISVSDTGEGMTPEVFSKIFDWGFHTRGERGGGIGLPVAREIIEGHGGWIEAETKLGTGSVFKVILPGVSIS